MCLLLQIFICTTVNRAIRPLLQWKVNIQNSTVLEISIWRSDPNIQNSTVLETIFGGVIRSDPPHINSSNMFFFYFVLPSDSCLTTVPLQVEQLRFPALGLKVTTIISFDDYKCTEDQNG